MKQSTCTRLILIFPAWRRVEGMYSLRRRASFFNFRYVSLILNFEEKYVLLLFVLPFSLWTAQAWCRGYQGANTVLPVLYLQVFLGAQLRFTVRFRFWYSRPAWNVEWLSVFHILRSYIHKSFPSSMLLGVLSYTTMHARVKYTHNWNLLFSKKSAWWTRIYVECRSRTYEQMVFGTRFLLVYFMATSDRYCTDLPLVRGYIYFGMYRLVPYSAAKNDNASEHRQFNCLFIDV